MARILIIDDDDAFRAALGETLADLGHTPIEAATGKLGLELLGGAAPAAVFLDYKMTGMDGIEVLRRLRVSSRTSTIPVIMLTAFASSSNTIEAMKLGAFEHLTKPVARGEIRELLARLLEAPADIRAGSPGQGERLIGNSPMMREVHKLMGRAAATAATVLITGETGTGKELVARVLHESSERGPCPFIAVNCAAIPRDLLESELFGHVKGAFTGAVANRAGALQLANGGTLMLDEVGDMSLEMQSKLLRVIEERTVTPVGGSRPEALDLRIIAATHQDLAALVDEGNFRADLFFRLNVIPIHIPPLRERRDDIPLLADHFLSQAAGPEPKAFSQAAVERLLAHDWLGNVRELRNAMERVAAFAKGAVVDAADLAFLRSGNSERAVQEFNLALLDGDLHSAVEALERSMIRRALEGCGGNRAEAARRLGIHRQLLYKKLKQHRLA